jgi:hypothetical protein
VSKGKECVQLDDVISYVEKKVKIILVGRQAYRHSGQNGRNVFSDVEAFGRWLI